MLRVYEGAKQHDGIPQLTVCYGTSELKRLYPGELDIRKDREPAEYYAAGLEVDTKFDTGKLVTLAYDDSWFLVPKGAPFGQTPQIGTLHPRTIARLQAALRAARG